MEIDTLEEVKRLIDCRDKAKSGLENGETQFLTSSKVRDISHGYKNSGSWMVHLSNAEASLSNALKEQVIFFEGKLEKLGVFLNFVGSQPNGYEEGLLLGEAIRNVSFASAGTSGNGCTGYTPTKQDLEDNKRYYLMNLWGRVYLENIGQCRSHDESMDFARAAVDAIEGRFYKE